VHKRHRRPKQSKYGVTKSDSWFQTPMGSYL
jgi:hypothetical protein